MRTRGKQIILQPTRNHPPPNRALKSYTGANAYHLPRHVWRNFAASDEVYGRDEGGETDDATPESVCPFEEVDLFEFVEGHAWVELLEFGRGAVFCEFGLPVSGVGGWEGTCDGAPFCYA